VSAPHFIHDLNRRFVGHKFVDEAYNEITNAIEQLDCKRAGAEWDARKQPDQMPHVCIPMEKDR
jgi:hypothetical protein